MTTHRRDLAIWGYAFGYFATTLAYTFSGTSIVFMMLLQLARVHLQQQRAGGLLQVPECPLRSIPHPQQHPHPATPTHCAVKRLTHEE
ncbi:hypothetical protein [Cystobacter fuscus]|nr:hypothetical protein [Cystobacter fuscus]